MSETAAISSVPVTPPGPAPRAAETRTPSDEVDLYAEANAFSEADWAGPEMTDLFGEDGLDFRDFLDVINPLHHLPVVGTVYRALTGDELAPAPRVIGGTLFGGIAGFVSSLANAVLENETGHDMGDTVLALFSDDTPAPANIAATTIPLPETGRTAETAQRPANAPTAAAQASTPPGTATAIPTAVPGGIDLRDVLQPKAADNRENPTAALIQARAAVPKSARPAASAIPGGALQSSITLPGGKSLPIQFRSGRGTVVSPQPTPQDRPQPASVATKTAATGATADGRPRSLQPTAPAAAAPAETLAAATPAQVADQEIASKMLNALDKYETLMRSRTAPSISGEI
jgi:hypothetical protein